MQSRFIKEHGFEALLCTVVMAVHLYAATSDAFNFPVSWFTRDDAYYYFKVAQNITEGHGITFDGVNLTNGYHPLWMILNIPIFTLARVDLVLPLRLLLLIQGAFSAVAAILIYRVARGAISPLIGVTAAVWWAFDLSLHNIMYEYGLETGLASLAVTLLLYQLFKFEKTWRTDPPALAKVAALAAFGLFALFSRLDLVFLAGLAGLWIIFRGTPLRILLPLDMLLAAASVFAGFFVRVGVSGYYDYAQAGIFLIAISTLTKLALYFFLGLYQPISSRSFKQTLMSGMLAVSGSTLICAAIMLAASPLLGGFPRMVLLYDWVFNLLGLFALRGIWRVFSQNKDQAALPPLEFLKARLPGWFREGAAYFGTLLVPLGLYMLFNRLVIGTAMPVSGQIKRWWGTPGSRAYGGAARDPLAFWGADMGADFNAWNPITGWLEKLSRIITEWQGFYRNDETYAVLLIVTGVIWLLVLLVNRRKAIRAAMQTALPLLFTASAVQVLSYNATGYSAMKEWYWITEPVFFALALGLAAWLLLRPLIKGRAGQAVGWLITAWFCLWMAWNFSASMFQRMPHGINSPGRPLIDSVQFLERFTPPGSMIGMTGGGNVGYYIQDRTIVNMDGLINSPRYFEALKAGQGSQFLSAMGLDYVFANPDILQGVPYKDQFSTGPILERYGGKALMELLP